MGNNKNHVRYVEKCTNAVSCKEVLICSHSGKTSIITAESSQTKNHKEQRLVTCEPCEK